MNSLTHNRRLTAVLLALGCFLLGSAAAPRAARAYVLEGYRWPDNQPIVLNLQLGSPGRVLLDGTASWDDVADDAVYVWNEYLGGGVQFQTNRAKLTPAQGDGINSVFFSATVYGDDFGSDTLAVTLSFYKKSTTLKTEADVIFNSAKGFDSHRGPLVVGARGGGSDLRRVAIHEFGHVLGLDHTPDGAPSIMTPYINDFDTVQADDIAGVESIYGQPSDLPYITGLLRQTIAVGGQFRYFIQGNGSPTDFRAEPLPDGLSLNPVTGFISGAPATEGTYHIVLSAANASGQGAATMILIVGSIPVITSPLSVTAYWGLPFSYRITASGQPTIFDAYSMPEGLTLDPTTGLISGTIAAGGPTTLTAANALGKTSVSFNVGLAFDSAVDTLHVFRGGDGYQPAGAALVQGADGNFYGTTEYGGTSNAGTVFRMAPDGTVTTLHSFLSTEGTHPVGGVIQAADGELYGTTYDGGAYGRGIVFKVASDGTFTTLYNFSTTEGNCPYSRLVQGSDGNLYGTTKINGLLSSTFQDSLFKITPEGALTWLHTFEVAEDRVSALIQARDGNFYGTARTGGDNHRGAVFRMTPDGVLTTIHSFDIYSGYYPATPLLEGADGNFYGTTESSAGVNIASTIFKMLPDGVLTTLHTFKLWEGHLPSALVEGKNGKFYGTTGGGGKGTGPIGQGSVFEMTSEGVLTTLHTFPFFLTDLPGPSPLVRGATDGEFYGTTTHATNGDGGTIYRTTLGGDTLPVATLEATIPSVTVGSGGQAVFTVRLSEARSKNVLVHYVLKGSAANGTDYAYLKGTVKIKAGKTSKTVAIVPLGDLRGLGKRVVKIALVPDAAYMVGTTGALKAKILAGK